MNTCERILSPEYMPELTIKQEEMIPLQDHCGVVAVFSPHAQQSPMKNIHALERLTNRGHSGAGVVGISPSSEWIVHKANGSVSDVFNPEVVAHLEQRKASMWLGQVRYTTSGDETHVQPLLGTHLDTNQKFCVTHNGQFSCKPGQENSTLSDSVLFTQSLSVAEADTFDNALTDTLESQGGAWSLIIGTENALYLSRDPHNVRPLVYGYLEDSEDGQKTWYAASETYALEAMGVTDFYEVLPGQTIKITHNSLEELHRTKRQESSTCAMEIIYFQNKESKATGASEDATEINRRVTVEEARESCGRILAHEHPLVGIVDFVVGVPSTGITGAKAYADELGIEYNQVITDREPDMPRTFLGKIESIYERVMHNFNFDVESIKGKSVAVIDDSIVRGNVSKAIVWLLKNICGAKEVHVLSLSPIIDKRCHLGISTQNKELLAHIYGSVVSEMCEAIEADSLGYLSTDGLQQALGYDNGFCFGCMAGQLPPIDEYGRSTTLPISVIPTSTIMIAAN